MSLSKIDTLEELEQEKMRLKRESSIALDLFQRQLAVTANSGKKALISNWKTVVPIVAAAGIKRFVNTTTEEADSYQSQAPNTVLESIQEGLSIFQKPGNDKWLSLIPFVKRLWEQYAEGLSGASTTGSTLASEEVDPAPMEQLTY